MFRPLKTSPRTLRTRTTFLGAWLLAGLLCIFVDDQLQPRLSELGRTSVASTCAKFWQELGAAPGISLFMIAGIASWRADRGHTALRFTAVAATAGIAVQSLKHLVGRARPEWVHDQTHFFGPLGVLNSGPYVPIDSMPSGHTAVAFAMAVALSGRWPAMRVLWYLLASGVGMARTLVDRHFPSDVILGGLLGTTVGIVVSRVIFPVGPTQAAGVETSLPMNTCPADGERHETQGF